MRRSADYSPKGDPDNPMSDAEISAKYHGFADSVLGRARADAIESTVAQLDHSENVADLLRLICDPLA